MDAMKIRLRTEDDDPQIISIRNEANPHLPPISLEEYRFGADPANAEGVDERFVAEKDGKVLGLYVLSEMKFFKRPNTFAGNAGVAVSERGKGIGTMLYNHLFERATGYGATRLYGNVSEDNVDSFSFLERRGFSRSGRANRMSRLKVSEANLDGYERIVEKVESGGIVIKTLAEIGTDNEPMMRKIHRLWVESARDIPSSEEFGEVPYELWLKFLRSPGTSPEQTWVALEGDTPAGVAGMSRRGNDAAFNDYTGVSRAYRGRGLARALKLKTVEWARQAGIESIFTGNDVANDRMLSINIPMGYEKVPNQVEVVRDIL